MMTSPEASTIFVGRRHLGRLALSIRWVCLLERSFIVSVLRRFRSWKCMGASRMTSTVTKNYRHMRGNEFPGARIRLDESNPSGHIAAMNADQVNKAREQFLCFSSNV
jgi:hypothetical protein